MAFILEKGYVVHLWSAIKGGGIVVLTTLRKFRPAIKGRCEDRTIYVLNRKKIEKDMKLDFFNRKQIIQNAVNEIVNLDITYLLLIVNIGL